MSKGGITLDQLDRIPYSQYKLLRKAAELEEISDRQKLIADMNAAFNANKKHVKELEKTFHKIAGHTALVDAHAKPDTDWKSRVLRFKR